MSVKGAVSAVSRESLMEQIAGQLSGARQEEVRRFIAEFLRRVPSGDLARRDAADWFALANGMLDFLRERRSGVVKLRVFNPTLAEDGFESSHSVVQIVTDDMPFLVDSASMAIAQAGLAVHTVIHPVFLVQRDPGGHVLAIDSDVREATTGQAESVMHFEVDRIADASDLNGLKQSLITALEDVRASVSDWKPMRDKMLAIAEDMAVATNIPADADGIAEGQEFLRWGANDHFTFLGYREYRVAKSGDDEVLAAVDGSGLGILRGLERSVAPRSLKTLVASELPHAGAVEGSGLGILRGLGRSVAPRSLKTLVATELPHSGAVDAIILTKTNARSRVHRPGYMDYIGVLEFDKDGVPIAEQRFLGMFSSA